MMRAPILQSLRRLQRQLMVSAALGLAALAGVGPAVRAADDVRTPQIEQDVRDLQRTVREQARRIDALERQLARLSGPSPSGARPGSEKQPSADRWLDPAAWDRVRAGMSAQEVIAVLGVPASVRDAADARSKVLLYALQVGASGFLAGSVTLDDDHVRSIAKPVLK